MVTIKISNRALYTFIAVFMIVLIAGIVFAYDVSLGSIPSPGHALASIQGLFSGDANLQETLSNKFCQTDGTNCQAIGSGYFVWRRASKSGSYYGCKSTCDGSIVLAVSNPKCNYYTDGVIGGSFKPEGYVICGSGGTKYYYAKRKSKDSTEIGELLVK